MAVYSQGSLWFIDLIMYMYMSVVVDTHVACTEVVVNELS